MRGSLPHTFILFLDLCLLQVFHKRPMPPIIMGVDAPHDAIRDPLGYGASFDTEVASTGPLLQTLIFMI